MHLLRKLGFYLVALWAAVTLNFFIPRLLPGSPVDAVLAKLALRGPVDPGTRRAIEIMLGADDDTPMIQQYFAYLGGLFTGDLGISVTYFPTPVTQIIAQSLPWTLVLEQYVEPDRASLPFADEDGIVCVPPVRGEASAADRLLNLLAAAYGDAWSTDVLAELLKSASHAGKTLETWLRDKFFTQHCKLFQNRPFIWHIWDGLPHGFSALVNYHQLDRKNLETLIYTYLGDWIGRQKQDKNNGIDGAEERLAAAETLKKSWSRSWKVKTPTTSSCVGSPSNNSRLAGNQTSTTACA